MKTAALVLGAGRGARLGGAVPKAFVALHGRTLLERSLATMARMKEIDIVQPVLAEADLPRLDVRRLDFADRIAAPVPGGVERQDSVAAGLAALPEDIELVAVHDAARCLVEPQDVARVLAEAREHGAALLAVPARDTIKRVRDGKVIETPERASCWVAQTPQVFHVGLLREALEEAGREGRLGTDDAELVERLGVTVRVVEGRASNIKITLPEDLRLAELLLAERDRPEAQA
jgi:2-C-methyl-D-erythritol 4-phosphate cytidylyltransferase